MESPGPTSRGSSVLVLPSQLSALSKYRYEKKLELFKETNVNIFKKGKVQVLAAISTMRVFKRAAYVILYSGPILTFAECSQ